MGCGASSAAAAHVQENDSAPLDLNAEPGYSREESLQLRRESSCSKHVNMGNVAADQQQREEEILQNGKDSSPGKAAGEVSESETNSPAHQVSTQGGEILNNHNGNENESQLPQENTEESHGDDDETPSKENTALPTSDAGAASPQKEESFANDESPSANGADDATKTTILSSEPVFTTPEISSSTQQQDENEQEELDDDEAAYQAYLREAEAAQESLRRAEVTIGGEGVVTHFPSEDVVVPEHEASS